MTLGQKVIRRLVKRPRSPDNSLVSRYASPYGHSQSVPYRVTVPRTGGVPGRQVCTVLG
jgi:hypothetical protein